MRHPDQLDIQSRISVAPPPINGTGALSMRQVDGGKFKLMISVALSTTLASVARSITMRSAAIGYGGERESG